MKTYVVRITDPASGETQHVTVDADSFRDAALTAAETPFDLWTQQ